MRLSMMTTAYAAVALAGLTLLLVNPSGRNPAPPAPAGPVLVFNPEAAPAVAPAPVAPAPVAPAAPATTAALPDADALPDSVWGQTVRRGRDLLARTYALVGPEVADPAMRYAGNNLACANCHLGAGGQRAGLSLIGTYADYPRYDARFGRIGTMDDRINECMTRSMNGHPLPLDGPEMRAIMSYLKFLSEGIPVGAGMKRTPPIAELSRPASPERGKAVFTQQCAACHGADGLGVRNGAAGDAKGYQFPPLWGPDSFNNGAGMARLITAANFVHGNMPMGTTPEQPVLSVDDAWDVMAFVLSQPRPVRAGIDNDFPVHAQKPVDAAYPPYWGPGTPAQHKYGPFGPLRSEK